MTKAVYSFLSVPFSLRYTLYNKHYLLTSRQVSQKRRAEVEMEVTSPSGCESVFSLTSSAGSRAHLYRMADASAPIATHGANNGHAGLPNHSTGIVDRPSLAKVKVRGRKGVLGVRWRVWVVG